jgi:hypothetical protein
LVKLLRKISWKHLLSLFWRLYSYNLNFFLFFLKFLLNINLIKYLIILFL